MKNLALPQYVVSALSELERGGHKAYVVGGCVRDLLMGRIPNDYDICTSALPEETMSVFPRSHPTGIKHGTVTVVVDSVPLEITTFRADGEYSDHRRPESVEFISDLETDLMRRDFTMNAMAMSKDGTITDLFGGISDIRSRTIRCVGDPERRFEEDALRMLRAIRFSAQLNFEIDSETMTALIKKAPLTEKIANERRYVELKKVLQSGNPQVVSELIDRGLMCGIVGDGKKSPDLYPLKAVPPDVNTRIAALCVLLIRGGTIESAMGFFSHLRAPNDIARCTDVTCEIVLSDLQMTEFIWKRLLSFHHTEDILCAATVMDSLKGQNNRAMIDDFLQRGDCVKIKQLTVDGEDLKTLGLKGFDIGNTLNELLDVVLKHPEKNTQDILMNLAAEMIQ